MKKPSVTIGVVVFNEQANIRAMLNSVLVQNERYINIKKIIVVSDGSTDDTVKIIRSFKNRKVVVIAHKLRLGQPSRLREIFRSFQTDILVNVDGDNVLGDKNAIENITEPICKYKDMGVVAGNTIPMPGKTLLEKAINNYIFARQAFQSEYNFGKKALVAHAYLAYSKEFAKQCYFPKDILNFDAYSYFVARDKGFRFGYAHNSVAYYRSARHIREYINQTTRHITGGKQLYNYFSKETVDKGFIVPKNIMKKIMFYQIKQSIIGYVLLKILFSFCQLRSKRSSEKANTKWEFVTSTKSTIVI